MSDTEILSHTLSEQEIFSQFHTTAEGLSDIEATQRLEQYGPNELTLKKKRSRFSLFRLLCGAGPPGVKSALGTERDVRSDNWSMNARSQNRQSFL